MPDIQVTTKCGARQNKKVPCKGKYLELEGLCQRHAILFREWLKEGNYKVSKKNYSSGWKESKFYQWLNTLMIEEVEAIEDMK